MGTETGEPAVNGRAPDEHQTPDELPAPTNERTNAEQTPDKQRTNERQTPDELPAPTNATDVRLKVIPHTAQRYPTAGDWYHTGYAGAFVTASDTGDADSNFLILVHELVEMYLCQRDGVTQQAVDEFDVRFEERRARGEAAGEPGDHPDAPYRAQHRAADEVERLLAAKLGVDWGGHERRVEALGGE